MLCVWTAARVSLVTKSLQARSSQRLLQAHSRVLADANVLSPPYHSWFIQEVDGSPQLDHLRRVDLQRGLAWDTAVTEAGASEHAWWPMWRPGEAWREQDGGLQLTGLILAGTLTN